MVLVETDAGSLTPPALASRQLQGRCIKSLLIGRGVCWGFIRAAPFARSRRREKEPCISGPWDFSQTVLLCNHVNGVLSASCESYVEPRQLGDLRNGIGPSTSLTVTQSASSPSITSFDGASRRRVPTSTRCCQFPSVRGRSLSCRVRSTVCTYPRSSSGQRHPEKRAKFCSVSPGKLAHRSVPDRLPVPTLQLNLC